MPADFKFAVSGGWIAHTCYNKRMERQRGHNGISKTGRYRAVRHTLSALFHEGWDEPAITEVLKVIEVRADGVTLDEYDIIYNEVTEAARRVGSELYTVMFEACALPAAEKALLPIYQMDGYIDEYGMLQLPGALADESGGAASEAAVLYRFDPAMAPDGRFLCVYAQTVVKGFPHGLSLALAKDPAKNTDSAKLSIPEELADAMRMVHQFRMYIDRQNLAWVRTHYPDEPTDLARLLAYDKDLQSTGSEGLYFGEPSRYHNKLHLAEVFFRQINDKIETGDRHSEFIVDTDTSMFVSQWDVLKISTADRLLVQLPADIERDAAAQRRLLNSESFNYATGPKHILFDVLPASAQASKSLDFDLKQQLKSGADWREVERSEYTEMFKKKEQVEGVVYTDIESISGTSRRAKHKRKKEAKKAKEQMKINRKKARQAKVTTVENGVIIATIVALVAAAGLVVWQTVMDAKQSAEPAETETDTAE